MCPSSSSSKYGGTDPASSYDDEESYYSSSQPRDVGTVDDGIARRKPLPWLSVAALVTVAMFGISFGLYGRKLDFASMHQSHIADVVSLLTTPRVAGSPPATFTTGKTTGGTGSPRPGPTTTTTTVTTTTSTDEVTAAIVSPTPEVETAAVASSTTESTTAAASATTTSIIGGTASVSLAFANVEGIIEVSSPNYGVSQALAHLPWDAVAEAYREQQIRVILSYTSSTGVTVAANDDDIVVKWQILGQKYTGTEATFVAAAIPGVYECTVTVHTTSDNTELFSNTFNMAVKYIRREVRSLTVKDRETFFKALKIFYEIDAATGKKLYGEKFNNAEYFLMKHLDGAGRSDCDHWHDGAAFVNKHLAFTMEAEQALQAVDKSIAMPYWEYFQDAYLERWQDSEVFGEEWYGEASPMNDDHAAAGIWRDLQMPDASSLIASWSIKEEGSLNPFVNAYGHMRSPWNNNPSKYVGRHNQTYGFNIDHMPNCKVMSQCYSSSDLSAMTNCLNGVTHGPVHVLIGGAWGEGTTFDEGDLNFLRNINKVLYFKNLWRTGYTRCPTTCKDDEPCRCAIPQTYLDTYDVDTIFKNADIYDQIVPKLKNKDDAYKLKVLKALEDPGIVGEMLTSAAPYDPSFWPIHGQLERMLGLKRARKSKGEVSFEDTTWGFGGASGKFLAGVCDWSRIESVQDLTLPECDFTGETTCTGHGEHDTLEFANFLDLKETYTNAEFYEFVHPWSDSLPYTYDKFDFDYCSTYGVSV